MYKTDLESVNSEKIKIEIICENQRAEINSLSIASNKMKGEIKLLTSSEKEETRRANILEGQLLALAPKKPNT